MRAVANEARRRIIKMFGRAVMTAIVFPLLIPPTALAADVQWTLERDETIVNTEVGAERWTITYRISDGRVVGNVHHEDGSRPSFVQCNRIEIDGAQETFECFGANACAEAPCEEEYIALDPATVATSLFLPPGTDVPPSDAARALQALTGTWRFEVSGPEPFTKEFQLGDRIRQADLPAPLLSLDGDANVTRAIERDASIEYEFLLTDIIDGDFHFYLFNVVGDDGVEGVYRMDEDERPLTAMRISE